MGKEEHKKEEQKETEETTSRISTEDEIAERIFKYSQGCSLIMVLIITIIVFILFMFFS